MGSLIKTWEIPGGIHPPENKAQSLQLPLGKVPLPPTLVLPLNQHIGTAAKPVVTVGERVLGGQLIAEDRKSTRLNSSHVANSYAVFCLQKKNFNNIYASGIPI